MVDQETYEELAQELMGEIGFLGRQIKPETRNAIRGEMSVMWALYQAERPLTPSELAEQAHLSSARVANILRSLEEKDLVERHHSLSDRRRVEVSLTVRGRATADARRNTRDREVTDYLRALGKNDARELIRIIRKSHDILEERLTRCAQKGELAE